MTEHEKHLYMRLLLIATLLVVPMLILTGWAWLVLPSDLTALVYWKSGSPMGEEVEKAAALLTLPASMLIGSILFAVLPWIEPRRGNLRRSMKAYVVTAITVLGFMAVTHTLTIISLFIGDLPLERIILPGTGVVLMVVGNYLGKVRSNFFFGFRTPWTLSSDLSWNKTHRAAGRAFMAYGIVLFLIGFLPNPVIWVSIASGVLIAAVVVLAIYSFIVWRNDPNKQRTGYE